MTALIAIEGIGPKYAAMLKEVGISTAEALLEQGATPKGRKAIADKSGIGDGLILQWVNHVDLFRIKGVGPEYADLLEAAGVDTIPEMAQRRADHLFEKMVAVNLDKKLVRKMPIQSQVANWIEQAKTLPRLISY